MGDETSSSFGSAHHGPSPSAPALSRSPSAVSAAAGGMSRERRDGRREVETLRAQLREISMELARERADRASDLKAHEQALARARHKAEDIARADSLVSSDLRDAHVVLLSKFEKLKAEVGIIENRVDTRWRERFETELASERAAAAQARAMAVRLQRSLDDVTAEKDLLIAEIVDLGFLMDRGSPEPQARQRALSDASAQPAAGLVEAARQRAQAAVHAAAELEKRCAALEESLRRATAESGQWKRRVLSLREALRAARRDTATGGDETANANANAGPTTTALLPTDAAAGESGEFAADVASARVLRELVSVLLRPAPPPHAGASGAAAALEAALLAALREVPALRSLSPLDSWTRLPAACLARSVAAPTREPSPGPAAELPQTNAAAAPAPPDSALAAALRGERDRAVADAAAAQTQLAAVLAEVERARAKHARDRANFEARLAAAASSAQAQMSAAIAELDASVARLSRENAELQARGEALARAQAAAAADRDSAAARAAADAAQARSDQKKLVSRLAALAASAVAKAPGLLPAATAPPGEGEEEAAAVLLRLRDCLAALLRALKASQTARAESAAVAAEAALERDELAAALARASASPPLAPPVADLEAAAAEAAAAASAAAAGQIDSLQSQLAEAQQQNNALAKRVAREAAARRLAARQLRETAERASAQRDALLHDVRCEREELFYRMDSIAKENAALLAAQREALATRVAAAEQSAADDGGSPRSALQRSAEADAELVRRLALMAQRNSDLESQLRAFMVDSENELAALSLSGASARALRVQSMQLALDDVRRQLNDLESSDAALRAELAALERERALAAAEAAALVRQADALGPAAMGGDLRWVRLREALASHARGAALPPGVRGRSRSPEAVAHEGATAKRQLAVQQEHPLEAQSHVLAAAHQHLTTAEAESARARSPRPSGAVGRAAVTDVLRAMLARVDAAAETHFRAASPPALGTPATLSACASELRLARGALAVQEFKYRLVWNEAAQLIAQGHDASAAAATATAAAAAAAAAVAAGPSSTAAGDDSAAASPARGADDSATRIASLEASLGDACEALVTERRGERVLRATHAASTSALRAEVAKWRRVAALAQERNADLMERVRAGHDQALVAGMAELPPALRSPSRPATGDSEDGDNDASDDGGGGRSALERSLHALWQRNEAHQRARLPLRLTPEDAALVTPGATATAEGVEASLLLTRVRRAEERARAATTERDAATAECERTRAALAEATALAAQLEGAAASAQRDADLLASEFSTRVAADAFELTRLRAEIARLRGEPPPSA